MLVWWRRSKKARRGIPILHASASVLAAWRSISDRGTESDREGAPTILHNI